MNRIAPIRRASLLLLLAGPLAFAQSPTLPATPPTSVPPAATTVTAASQAPTQPVGHRAQVVFAQGQLQITADNSSLNQILREIARQSGMKITGGVADQRVFGNYGPASPAQILAGLLAGTGSNMLLRVGPERLPVELILTPREGGPTPPNPNAASFEDEAPVPDEPRPAPPVQQYQPPQPQAPSSSDLLSPPPAITQTPPESLPAAGSISSLTDASNPPTPGAIKTPQEIFQQLQVLQQQQQSAPK